LVSKCGQLGKISDDAIYVPKNLIALFGSFLSHFIFEKGQTKFPKMALHLPKSELTKEQDRKIRADLMLTPSVAASKFSSYSMESPDPIFLVSEISETDEICLPRFYAEKTLKIVDKRERPAFDYVETDIELRPYQVPVFCKALKLFQQHGTMTLRTFPGSGKTMMCTMLASVCCGIVLFLVHLSVQPRQWLKTLRKLYPSLAEQTWIPGENECPPNVRFIICMIRRTSKIPLSLRKQVGCVVIDEAHLLCTRSYVDSLLAFDSPRVIVATATLERKDGMEEMMYKIAGSHSVLLINKDPHLIVRYDTGLDFEIIKNSRGVADYNNLISRKCACEERNIQAISLLHCNPHRKFIVLTLQKEHAETLKEMCLEAEIEVDTLYGTKRTYRDSRVLIGTVSKIGTAFDEENGCESFLGEKSNTLLLMFPIKTEFDAKQIAEENLSKVKTWEQVRGRVMRSKKPSIIVMVDKDRIAKDHFNRGKRWFEYTCATLKTTSNPCFELPPVGQLPSS
jgi:hypothetical protein